VNRACAGVRAVALGRRRSEPPQERGQVATAQLLGEQCCREGVDSLRAHPALQADERRLRRHPELELGPHP
jgi:hypothetical protein